MDTEQPVDFSLLLASSVHDIKNSLGMLLTAIDEIVDQHGTEHNNHYRLLRSEASRINNALIHLLGIYRLQNQQLAANLQEIFIREFLEEQIEAQKLLFDVSQIQVSIDCDNNLSGFFDENLIAGVINNILVNCAKYTHNNIAISAEYRADYLHICINDNGNGYPQDIIDTLGASQRSIDFVSGSTNLGLFFCQQIAALHRCKDRCGSIKLSNTSVGGCFELLLP